MEPAWLVWARELQAIAQTGLAFTTGTYDRERYMAIRAVASKMMAVHSDADFVHVEALFAKETGYATPKETLNKAGGRWDQERFAGAARMAGRRAPFFGKRGVNVR